MTKFCIIILLFLLFDSCRKEMGPSLLDDHEEQVADNSHLVYSSSLGNREIDDFHWISNSEVVVVEIGFKQINTKITNIASIIDVKTNEVKKVYNLYGDPYSSSVSVDKRYLYYTVISDNPTFLRLDLLSGEQIILYENFDLGYPIVVSSDDKKTIIHDNTSGIMYLCDIQNKQKQEIKIGFPIIFTNDNCGIYYTNSKNKALPLYQYDFITGENKIALNSAPGYYYFTVSQNINKDTYLVFSNSASESLSVYIYNLTTNQLFYKGLVYSYSILDNSILTNQYISVDFQNSMLYFWKFVCHRFESTSLLSGDCTSFNYHLNQLNLVNRSSQIIGSIANVPSLTKISPDGKVVALIKTVKSGSTSVWRRGWVYLSTLNTDKTSN